MNIINAIINLAQNPIFELRELYWRNNRANSMGDALEEYVKDIFADTFTDDEATRSQKFSEVFSYLGNKNNPPDAMLRGGDAIEVKKLEGEGMLALNSSYPKHTLKVTNAKITSACRSAENWTEKDMIYVVGNVQGGNNLKSLCMVYGLDYCASDDCYKRLEDTIKGGIEQIEDVQLEETRELGHINNVDPLGITYMRIRGMWGITNPWTVFRYVFENNNNNEFTFMGIINEDKWNSFDNTDDLMKLSEKLEGLNVKDVKVKNPDNPANLRNAKLITFEK